jgi:DNA (cytosine-5)-methyltransferase 1
MASANVTAASEAIDRDVETLEQYRGRLIRAIARRNGTIIKSDMGDADLRLKDPAALHARADRFLLRVAKQPQGPSSAARITVADLFCGIGALSWGVCEAARALGIRSEIVLAADADPAPLGVYDASLCSQDGATRCLDLGSVLSGHGSTVTTAERAFLRNCQESVDIVVAGPPCQGHSRLNNHTRHDDPRNDLYARVVRFIELCRPALAIIENVDTITSDQRGSTHQARLQIEKMGYAVSDGTVHLHDLGVPQLRRRHLLIATRADQASMEVDVVVARYAVARPDLRTVRWAIGDLTDRQRPTPFDSPSTPSVDNRRRLRWFQEHPGERDLPNVERPDCHRLPRRQSDGSMREHSYRSMYGRLDGDGPAQTITSGFGSMGQGRYVHPDRPRTLTPHEAARLQFVPDFFDFSSVQSRGRLARMIGNVAPMKLSYVFALEFLR